MTEGKKGWMDEWMIYLTRECSASNTGKRKGCRNPKIKFLRKKKQEST